MKRAVRLPDSASILASAKTDFSSDTLVVTAEIDLKRRPAASARSRAIDVFPVPGPPQKTIDERRLAASIRPIGAFGPKIGRAHVRTPLTNAHLVCRLLLEKNKQQHTQTTNRYTSFYTYHSTSTTGY